MHWYPPTPHSETAPHFPMTTDYVQGGTRPKLDSGTCMKPRYLHVPILNYFQAPFEMVRDVVWLNPCPQATQEAGSTLRGNAAPGLRLSEGEGNRLVAAPGGRPNTLSGRAAPRTAALELKAVNCGAYSLRGPLCASPQPRRGPARGWRGSPAGGLRRRGQEGAGGGTSARPGRGTATPPAPGRPSRPRQRAG